MRHQYALDFQYLVSHTSDSLANHFFLHTRRSDNTRNRYLPYRVGLRNRTSFVFTAPPPSPEACSTSVRPFLPRFHVLAQCRTHLVSSFDFNVADPTAMELLPELPSPMSPFAHFNSCPLSLFHSADGDPEQHPLNYITGMYNVQAMTRAFVEDASGILESKASKSEMGSPFSLMSTQSTVNHDHLLEPLSFEASN